MSTALHDDASTSVLRRMKEGGFDFAQFHPIEFYAIFPDEERARMAASNFRGESLNAQITPREDGIWHLQVSKVMYATQAGIGAFEQSLESIVVPLGGMLDGWGVTQEVRPTKADLQASAR
ncbi:ribonuclease E inhibitor RraB [Pseudomonas sp. NCHU5208]|uniref:ribonuclease E inhibitor RraB n=1 Tax=unclassified Pseudomonas TaxID=196821 RepID=UPI003F9CA007